MCCVQVKLYFRHLSITLFALFITACDLNNTTYSSASTPATLTDIKKSGILRVGMLNNNLSYYIGTDGPNGLDYELALLFAKELDVKLEVVPIFSQSNLLSALKNGEIDIIAAGLSQLSYKNHNLRAAPAYYYVKQAVIYKKGQLRPRDIEHLLQYQSDILEQNSKNSDLIIPCLKIIEHSPAIPRLNSLKLQYPNLQFDIVSHTDNYELMQQVSDGTLAFTIADSVEFSLARRLHPDLALAFELTDLEPMSWFIKSTNDSSLYGLLIEFFGHIRQSGALTMLEEKYIGHIEQFDYVDTRAFIRALDASLPKWELLFQKYAGEFDWRLMAALAYQESHWNPRAKSPTGVRGMMMLTLPTAQSVGVANRLDPEQSIRGGIQYLRKIFKKIPDSITEHEKIWFALASYNIGYGHMMDARQLTKSLGGNPDSWADIKENLPLLKKKAYYKKTRYGYARGDEAVKYVENIRRYYQSIIGHIDHKTIMERNINEFHIITPAIEDINDT